MKQKIVKTINVEVENNKIIIEKIKLDDFKGNQKDINKSCYGYRTESGHYVRNSKFIIDAEIVHK